MLYSTSIASYPTKEPALFREPTRLVNETDKTEGLDFALVIGRVVGPHVVVSLLFLVQPSVFTVLLARSHETVERLECSCCFFFEI